MEFRAVGLKDSTHPSIIFGSSDLDKLVFSQRSFLGHSWRIEINEFSGSNDFELSQANQMNQATQLLREAFPVSPHLCCLAMVLDHSKKTKHRQSPRDRASIEGS